MKTIIIILAPISLLDSISIIPLCLLPIVILLSGRRPILGSGAFLLGIFTTYLIFGILIALGLSSLFDQINAYVSQIWKHPDTLDLILQIIIGVILLIFGFRRSLRRERREATSVSESITPAKAFIIAAGLIIVGMPGALPYLAAIDQLLRADLTVFEMVLALLYYNVLFILPLAALVFIRVFFPRQSESIFDYIKDMIAKWGRGLIRTLLVILGFVMVIDGIGWFLGMPLIPVQ